METSLTAVTTATTVTLHGNHHSNCGNHGSRDQYIWQPRKTQILLSVICGFPWVSGLSILVFNKLCCNTIIFLITGWVWLCRHGPRKLRVVQTQGEDSPISMCKICNSNRYLDPILALDMWEHAYWPQYQFR